MKLSVGFMLALALLLAGCSEEERPPVQPLAAEPAELQQLYKWGEGPWPVVRETGISLPHAMRDEALGLNVYYPDSDEASLPVLVFSHGNWSTNDKYDALLLHWVSHGYVVLAPLHRDGSGGYLSGTLDLLRHGNLGLIQARVDDLVSVLDSLILVESLVPALAGRLDRSRLAATGHSFGAFNAQQLGGARAYDTDSDSYVSVEDDRIKAVVAISPPGEMFDEITAGSWSAQSRPTLMSTGTWDTNAMFWPDWRAHKISYETALAGDQYALVVQGADHYLGNLICRPELEEPPQQEALAMVNNSVVAFLDAYVKGELAALQYLRSGRLQAVTSGFALVETR